MTPEPVTRIKSKQPVPYDLTAIHQDTHDTKTFCFALPDNATLDMQLVEMFLLYANKTQTDIIYREEWEEVALEHASFRCYHVLSQPPAGWS